MPYSLSLLDKSPILDGEPATDAVRRSVALAQAAERLGYARFWLAEHHGAPGLASSAPEILIAHLAARTQRIRIGSGGVLLGHYSPYKVAETFNLLATLAPDRVDLGIGKAPGGLPFSTRALRARQAEAAPFGELLRELNDYLLDRSKASPGIDVAKAFPAPPAPPERFLLGASAESAALAAGLGWRLVFAGQLNGDPKALESSFETYAKSGGIGTPLLSVAALAAPTAEEARSITDQLRVVRVSLADGQSVNLGSEEQAAEFARQAGATDFRAEVRRPHVLSGTAEDVRRELDVLHARLGVSEFIIDTPVAATRLRATSVSLLAGEAPALAA
ncbi:MsnO8 family LLM class oxidoreductase [Bosea robiniae]|uniref:Luciferase family oxidoreductase, group 1 n=1 Tax=Bosea robiniae TaxID=1036780 RepID=A0ABY0NLC6_9HYPH|nr:MsnO8 family LLM class oxidoreductase [Bosea robiniae]SDF62820.1 luciferase family oxidoreductase, group 1 [Bosea robiniae]